MEISTTLFEKVKNTKYFTVYFTVYRQGYSKNNFGEIYREK